MIKKIKYLIFFYIYILFTGCSFDNVTGIWSGSEKEKKRIAEIEKEQKQIIDLVSIYSSSAIYTKEVIATKRAKLTNPKDISSWKMSGSNLQNSPGNAYLSGTNNNFLKKKIGKNKFFLTKVLSQPLFFEDDIILTDDTGNIFSINQTGKVNWKKNIYKKIYKKIHKNLTFSIYENKIYIADNIGFIYAINFVNGQLIWIKNHGVPLRSNIKIFDNKIYVVNQDNRLLCLDAENGNKIWDIRTISSFIKSQGLLGLAISKKNDLFMLNSSGDLLKVRAESGQVEWSLNTTDATFDHNTDFFKSSDIIIKDDDLILCTSSSIFSFNLNTGYLNWKQDIGSTNTPVIDGQNVFIVTDSGYFLNLDRLSGKVLWSTNILKSLKKRKRITNISGFILGSGKIYAATKNGYLIVSSATSGQVEEIKKIGDEISTSPIISNGSLYILTEKPKILGFN